MYAYKWRTNYLRKKIFNAIRVFYNQSKSLKKINFIIQQEV